MLSLALLLIAALLFLLAGVNQTLFSQGPADLLAFGLLAYVLSVLLSGWGPASPLRRGD